MQSNFFRYHLDLEWEKRKIVRKVHAKRILQTAPQNFFIPKSIAPVSHNFAIEVVVNPCSSSCGAIFFLLSFYQGYIVSDQNIAKFVQVQACCSQ